MSASTAPMPAVVATMSMAACAGEEASLYDACILESLAAALLLAVSRMSCLNLVKTFLAVL